jgi:hypothetical protein
VRDVISVRTCSRHFGEGVRCLGDWSTVSNLEGPRRHVSVGARRPRELCDPSRYRCFPRCHWWPVVAMMPLSFPPLEPESPVVVVVLLVVPLPFLPHPPLHWNLSDGLDAVLFPLHRKEGDDGRSVRPPRRR